MFVYVVEEPKCLHTMMTMFTTTKKFGCLGIDSDGSGWEKRGFQKGCLLYKNIGREKQHKCFVVVVNFPCWVYARVCFLYSFTAMVKHNVEKHKCIIEMGELIILSMDNENMYLQSIHWWKLFLSFLLEPIPHGFGSFALWYVCMMGALL